MEPILTKLGFDLALDPGRLILVGGLAAARVVPIFAIAPVFGGRLVPAPLRIGLSLAFVALVFPAVSRAVPDATALGPAAVSGLLLKEALLGALLAYLISVPIWAAEAAGRLMDTARGAANAELHSPELSAPTTPLGDLGLKLAIVVFFAVDGHLLFLRALGASYEAVPITAAPPALGVAAGWTLAVDAASRLLLAALGMAAPVLAALLLADVTLGLLNRVSPHIQVYFLGMPAKAALAVLVLVSALSGIILLLRGEFGAALTAISRLMGSS